MKTAFIFLLAGALSLLAAGSQHAAAQDVSSQAILDVLSPAKPAKRSSLAKGLSRKDIDFLNSLPTRGLKIEQREKLAAIIVEKELPRIDVRIQFELDSAAISQAAQSQIDALGTALADKRMADVRIALNGHTDATGTDAHNLTLSEARANAVRRALLASHDIDPARLLAAGFGEEQLRDRADPEGPTNRRVEVVRISP